MKNFFLALIFSCGASLYASDEAFLSDHLAPLKPFIGHWTMRHTNELGEALSGKAIVAPDTGGKTLVFRTEMLAPDGKVLYSRVWTFYWNNALKSIAETNFDSEGAHWSGAVARQSANKWVLQGHGYGSDGKAGAGRLEIATVNKNLWTARFERGFYGGEETPASPPFVFTRTK
jgi:hypothetical protein